MSGLNMTLNNVRVINPILSSVVQGYSDVANIGSELFPRVAVMQRGGQVIQFGKEAFKLYSTLRAPGSDTKRIQFGYAGKPFSINNHAIESIVPREWLQDAAQVPHIDLATKAVSLDFRVLSRELEVEQAKLATDATQYASTHVQITADADKWTNPASDPIAQLETARETIRSTVGQYPTIVALSAKAWAALKRHPKITDLFKYTSASSITVEMLAARLDLGKVVVGTGVYSDENGNFADIWGTDVVMAYVPAVISGVEQPSYGYTYTLDGNPLVEEAYWDNGKKSWVYGVTYERTPVIASSDSAFLFKAVA